MFHYYYDKTMYFRKSIAIGDKWPGRQASFDALVDITACERGMR